MGANDMKLTIKVLGKRMPTEDLISRAEAIDLLDKHASVCELTDDDFEWLKLRRDLYHLPSAQPEIVRCKDCRYNQNCDIQYHAQAGYEFYCGSAERRQDG